MPLFLWWTLTKNRTWCAPNEDGVEPVRCLQSPNTMLNTDSIPFSELVPFPGFRLFPKTSVTTISPIFGAPPATLIWGRHDLRPKQVLPVHKAMSVAWRRKAK